MFQNDRKREPGGLADLRIVLTLVPWDMRRQIGLLIATTSVIALLDLAAVAMMLPLMQVLTGQVASSGVATYVVAPAIGTDDRQRVLLAIALAVGAALLAKNAGLVCIRWWALSTTNKAMGAAQAVMLRRYLEGDYSNFRRRPKATVIQVITGSIPVVFNQVLLGYIQVIVDSLTIGVLMLSLVVMAPEASILAGVIFGGSAVVITRYLKPHALSLGAQALDLGKEAWRYLNPAIEGFRESRIFQREKLFVVGFTRNRVKYARLSAVQSLLGEMPKYILEVVMIFGILVIALLLFATREEGTAFGLLAVFAAAAVRIIPALNRLVATVNGIRTGKSQVAETAHQIRGLDSEGSAMKPKTPPVSSSVAAPLCGDIVVDGLTYRYPGSDTDVLVEVSATIAEGSTVALAGPSGAGKSTFADLLIGLLTPTKGTVMVGGVDTVEARQRWLGSAAMVSQQVYIWDAPIRDLITFGQPREEVDAALLSSVVERSQLGELVAGLPEGLDTWVGDGGARISGGQAQRIGIARALYAKPRYLILDEATSALDNHTEHQITATMDSLRGTMTVVAIAHRLSTIKNADVIFFFSKGRLVSRGTMSELRRNNAEFAELVKMGSIE